MIRQHRLGSPFIACACLALLACLAAPAGVGAEEPGFGIESVAVSRTTSKAGAHPDLTTFVSIKTDPTSPADGDGDHNPLGSTRDIAIELPPGLTGNPKAVSRCSSLQFTTALEGGGCPIASQVGIVRLHLRSLNTTLNEPIYNLEPPGGDTVARLGFYGFNLPVVIDVQLRSDSDYGLTATAKGANAIFPLVSAETIIWGVPGDPVHDLERITPFEVIDSGGLVQQSPPRSTGLPPAAFLSNPTKCGPGEPVTFGVTSYEEPDVQHRASAELPPTTQCGTLEFTPNIQFAPTTSWAESPTGLDVRLSIDQGGLGDPNGYAPASLRKVKVALPPGMTLNPSAADGLGACSEAQMGLISADPPRFDKSDPSCPSSSKVGSVQIVTPVLDEPIDGALYIAKPFDNPFGTLLAGYLVAQGQGVTIKLTGRIDLDPQTGQITAVFDENPQQPFSQLDLHFKSGNRGVLATPPTCGTYGVEAELSPWSGEPSLSDPDSFAVDRAPGGDTCVAGDPAGPGNGDRSQLPFGPGVAAGTAVPVAGAYSPFLLRVDRADGTQNVKDLSVKLPHGLLGRLAGIPYCSDAALASVSGEAGTGAGEEAAPACPAASQIGTVVAGAGVGSSPYYVRSGRAYLAGPYKGAPLSVAIVTPAVAGPFDLGSVVVRSAIFVDPFTTDLTVVSDPLPGILHGVPLDIRSISVRMDRSEFTLNPTNCEPSAVTGGLSSLTGAFAPWTQRFQVGGCSGLPFEPRLSLKLKGGTKRNRFPALKAVVTMKPGEANIAAAQVTLPHSAFLEQGHIDKTCSRPQLASHGCPASAVYGRAKAWSPLLDEPLEGPVYLATGFGYELPALVANLNGQIEVLLKGKVDTGRANGIRNTFELVPDAPVSRFELNMFGGKRGLIVNSENLCGKRAKRQAVARFIGQNGRIRKLQPVVRAIGCKGGQKKGKRSR